MTDGIRDDIEDYKYVVASDPGGTTGIAMLRYTDDTQPELVFLYQQASGMQGYWQFFEGSQPKENVVIVSESFEHREGVHKPDYTPLRIEGVQYAIWGDNVVYQAPSMKHLVPDSWLKMQNLWTPGHRHQMDALIHAFVYLRNEGHMPTLKALSDASDTPIAQPGEAEAKSMSSIMDAMAKDDDDQEISDEAASAVVDTMEALSMLYGGEPPERTEMPSSGDGDGEGDPDEGDGEGEGEGATQGDEQGDGENPTGKGLGGNGEGHDVEEQNVVGKRRRTLNGAFTGFDD